VRPSAEAAWAPGSHDALQLTGGGSIIAPASRACGQQQEAARRTRAKGGNMADSVYKIVELVGTSSESWERAAGAAVTQAGKSIRDLRIVEIEQLDMVVEKGKIKLYRAKVKVSFKIER
jgi:dodecin